MNLGVFLLGAALAAVGLGGIVRLKFASTRRRVVVAIALGIMFGGIASAGVLMMLRGATG